MKGDGSGLFVKLRKDPQDSLKPSRVLAADDRRFDGPEQLVGDISPTIVAGVGLDFNNEPKRSKCLFLLRAREEELNEADNADVGVLDTFNFKQKNNKCHIKVVTIA